MIYRRLHAAIRQMLTAICGWLDDFFNRSDSSRPMQMIEIRRDGKKTVRNVKQEPENRLLKLVFLWTLYFLFLLAAFNIAYANVLRAPALNGVSVH